MTETLYSGLAIAGPMDGKVIEGRYPGGILFVDKPTNKAWLYDYYSDRQEFYVRPLGYDALWNKLTAEQKFSIINQTTLTGIDATRELDFELVRKAAESNNTEVRALPEGDGE